MLTTKNIRICAIVLWLMFISLVIYGFYSTILYYAEECEFVPDEFLNMSSIADLNDYFMMLQLQSSW